MVYDMTAARMMASSKKKQPGEYDGVPEQQGTVTPTARTTVSRSDAMNQMRELDIMRRRLAAQKGAAYQSKDAAGESSAAFAINQIDNELRDLRRIAAPDTYQSPEKIAANRAYLNQQAQSILAKDGKAAEARATADPNRADTQLAVGQRMMYGYGKAPEFSDPRDTAMSRDMMRFAATQPRMDATGQITTPSLDARAGQMAQADQARSELAGIQQRMAALQSGQSLGPPTEQELAAISARRERATEDRFDANQRASARFAERRASIGESGAAPISPMGVEQARSKQMDEQARQIQIAQMRAQEAQLNRVASGEDIGSIRAQTEALNARSEFKSAQRAALLADNPQAARIAGDIVSSIKTTSGVNVNTVEERAQAARLDRAMAEISMLDPSVQGIVADQIISALQSEGLDVAKQPFQDEQTAAFLQSVLGGLRTVAPGAGLTPTVDGTVTRVQQDRVNKALSILQELRRNSMRMNERAMR